MTLVANYIAVYDFVAKDIKNCIICVSGRNDDFTATKRHGRWEPGYPEFDDLMDNFSEEKLVEVIRKLSTEAREALRKTTTVIGVKNHHRVSKIRKKSTPVVAKRNGIKVTKIPKE